ncbi:MAG: hypothetical protein R6X31_10720 [Anaerolineae bacterium]
MHSRTKETRLELTDTMFDVANKMSEGNPGALRVVMELLAEGGDIDPDNGMGGLGHVLSMDTLNLYSSKIWMLYKDVCGQDLKKMVAVLRGWQLGMVTKGEIHRAVDNWGAGLDVEDILNQVQERLPEFGREESNE